MRTFNQHRCRGPEWRERGLGLADEVSQPFFGAGQAEKIGLAQAA